MTWNSRSKKIVKTITLICIMSILSISWLVVHYDVIMIEKYKLEIGNYPELRGLALNITSECDERSCYYDAVRNFVMDIPYEKDGLGGDLETNNPPFTLENGGDCDSKTVLAINLLKSLGEKNLYFIIQADSEPDEDGKIHAHACWMGKPFDDKEHVVFYNCNSELDITRITRMV